MIDKLTIDKILETAEIVDVIGDFVSLRRRGANYIACCPFHNEKTPSFSVSPSKGIFKCFGCGKAGSAVTFLMEHEQLSYVEALKYLGKKYGIEVNDIEESEEMTADRLKRESMLAVSEFASKFFTDNLFNTSAGRAVGLSYFKQHRGFSDETIKKFGLGYSPSSKPFVSTEEHVPTLFEAAQKNGFKKEFLIATGLCFEHNGGRVLDKFYERVMFPIHSLSGRVIGFGGRTLKDDKSIAKYMNSPESEIYHKSNTLYGIFFAKSSISRLQKCYLVEGYTDVISMHQAGIENVVASSGTSLTIEQIRLIRRFTNKVTVLYDGDAAGIKASLRGIDMLLEEGLEIKVVLLPDGEDPDSYARGHSAQQIRDFLDSNEKDFIDFKYELLSSTVDKDPIRRSDLIREIIKTISVIPDQITRTVYIEQTATKMGFKQEALFQEVAKMRRKRIESGEYEATRRTSSSFTQNSNPIYTPSEEQDPRPENSGRGVVPILDQAEKELLYYILKFGECEMVFEQEQLYGGEQPLMRITVSQYISAQLENDGLALVNELYRRIYNEYYNFREVVIAQVHQEEDGSGGSAMWRELSQSEREELLQDKILKFFKNHSDSAIAKCVLNIIEDNYVVNVKEYIRSMIPERTVINKNVPHVVLIFKMKYIEYLYKEATEELRHYTKDTDPQIVKDKMNQLTVLSQVRTALIKELNRF